RWSRSRARRRSRKGRPGLPGSRRGSGRGTAATGERRRAAPGLSRPARPRTTGAGRAAEQSRRWASRTRRPSGATAPPRRRAARRRPPPAHTRARRTGDVSGAKLLHPALPRSLVVAPAHELRAVADPVAGDVVERHLADQLGPQPIPGELLVGFPAARL